MIKFSEEEISLCKQVAEKYKKDIKSRQYFYNNHLEKIQWSEKGQPKAKWAIPLWTISDCLEFFGERAFYLEGLCQIDECEYELCISEMDDMGVVRHSERRFQGTTKLEACLKAVIEVLNKEGK